MSDLSNTEKRKFEQILGMSSGYVLNFSNRTFEEFILDNTGRSIYDDRYGITGGSKACRMRGFWKLESNQTVGKLMGLMLDYALEQQFVTIQEKTALLDECRRVVSRLLRDSPVPELDALSALTSDRDFETVAKAVKDAIDNSQPEAGLDRLHTFTVKYFRTLCTQHGLTIIQDKPLHSLFGEYVKKLRDEGHIETEMTSRILKSSISIFDAFNDIRNNRSLAHDNSILNYEEALLIFNHVTNVIRFLRWIESLVQGKQRSTPSLNIDDIPF